MLLKFNIMVFEVHPINRIGMLAENVYDVKTTTYIGNYIFLAARPTKIASQLDIDYFLLQFLLEDTFFNRVAETLSAAVLIDVTRCSLTIFLVELLDQSSFLCRFRHRLDVRVQLSKCRLGILSGCRFSSQVTIYKTEDRVCCSRRVCCRFIRLKRERERPRE